MNRTICQRMAVLFLCCLAAVQLTSCSNREELSSPSEDQIADIVTTLPDYAAEIEPTCTPEPQDEDLVYIRDICPEIMADLHYATTNNFTGTVIYDFTEPQLRYGTAKKLKLVQRILEEQGFGLKIWDAYRPVWAQFKLWEICPDSTFVANPNSGYSNHSCGNTVDVTLVRMDGSTVEMPSDFDDFSPLADRDYSDVSDRAAGNARLLEKVMLEAGFTGYSAEWWHYTDTIAYPVIGE